MIHGVLAIALLVPCTLAHAAQPDSTPVPPAHAIARQALPTFDDHRMDLPSPILESEGELVQMYWHAWRLAFDNIERPPIGSALKHDYLDAAFNDNVFQWDTCFMMLFARYAHGVFPWIESLDNFYNAQHADGYICRELRKSTGEDFVFGHVNDTCNPPLFAWAEWEYFACTGDKARIRRVLPILEKHAQWIDAHRLTAPGLYWNTPLGSGMDNTPRTGGPGTVWVDMTAQVAHMHATIARMHEMLGQSDRASAHWQVRSSIASEINAHLWNQERGFYFDLAPAAGGSGGVSKPGPQQSATTIAPAWVLWAFLEDGDRRQRVSARLLDRNDFNRDVPFATLSAADPRYRSDGGYWLGASWAPTTYIAIKAIAGTSPDDAAKVAENCIRAMQRVFASTGTIWENYAPDAALQPDGRLTLVPGNPAKRDFVGWSGIGPIAVLIEHVIGVQVEAATPRPSVTWRIHRTDRHGVERLRVGRTVCSLIADARTDTSVPPSITLVCDGPIVMKLDATGSAPERREFPAGRHQIVLKIAEPTHEPP